MPSRNGVNDHKPELITGIEECRRWRAVKASHCIETGFTYLEGVTVAGIVRQCIANVRVFLPSVGDLEGNGLSVEKQVFYQG